MHRGYLLLVLHAHLPFVRHPEHASFLEERWLFEAITECYLPLLEILGRLAEDGVPYRLTLSLSPPLIAMLQEKGYSVLDMTDNEAAKLHIRYMVGGHAPCIKNECLYRFEFPERPGALLDFLSQMGQRWNISLFHYRNHGAAYGRVLLGVEIGPGEKREFMRVIRELKFVCWEETENPAYRLFAGPGCRSEGAGPGGGR